MVAGGRAVVEQTGRANVVAGVDQGAGEGVLDDFAFHAYSTDALRLLAQGAQQSHRCPRPARGDLCQRLDHGGQDLAVVGAFIGGGPAGQGTQVMGRGLHGQGEGEVEGVEDLRRSARCTQQLPYLGRIAASGGCLTREQQAPVRRGPHPDIRTPQCRVRPPPSVREVTGGDRLQRRVPVQMT